MLELTQIPEKFTVIGGGVIGLEMAAYYAAVGSKVTVVEMLDHIAGPKGRRHGCFTFVYLYLTTSPQKTRQGGGLKNHQPGASDKKYPPLVIVTVVCQPLKHN